MEQSDKDKLTQVPISILVNTNNPAVNHFLSFEDNRYYIGIYDTKPWDVAYENTKKFEVKNGLVRLANFEELYEDDVLFVYIENRLSIRGLGKLVIGTNLKLILDKMT